MLTLEYPVDRPDQLARAASRQVETVGQPGARLVVGLSPFDVPQGVSVSADAGLDTLTISFDYPNNEPPAPGSRLADEHGDTLAILGKNSGKVLRLHVERGLTALTSGHIPFEPQLAEDWALSLPAHAASTCVRNALLVRRILDAMPSRMRRHLAQDMVKHRVGGRQER